MSSKTSSSPPPSPSAIKSSQTLITRTEVAPKTRIVVVRATATTQNEQGENNETPDSSRSKSVELPPRFTNGRTSVYLIRRPIPPAEPSRPTQIFEPPPEEIHRTTTTTTRPINNNNNNVPQHIRTPSPPEEIKTITSTSSQFESTSTQEKTSKPSTRYNISIEPSPEPPVITHSKKPKKHSSSPIQIEKSQTGSKSETQNFGRSTSKPHSFDKHHVTPELILSTLTLDTPDEASRNTNRKPAPIRSFAQTKNTAVQVGSAPSETTKTEVNRSRVTKPTERITSAKSLIFVNPDDQTIAVVENPYVKNLTVKTVERPSKPIKKISHTLQQPPSTERVKSARSLVFVNPDDHTIAVVENPYTKNETIKSVGKRSKSFKNTSSILQQSQYHQETSSKDNESTEKLIKTSRSHTCLGCLSRYMCLIVIICLILILIGLAGVGVSAYFLATNINTGSNLTPEIVGIAVGGFLVIAALCFLCCVLACIGSHGGYFSYNKKGKRSGGQAFAWISPYHPNAHLYQSTDHHSEIYETKQTSFSTNLNSRPKSITHATKSFTIEMPEPLLTGRKLSPKTRERQLNKVINNIGHIVDDTKTRYNGELPTRVIVKVDKNTKATS